MLTRIAIKNVLWGSCKTLFSIFLVILFMQWVLGTMVYLFFVIPECIMNMRFITLAEMDEMGPLTIQCETVFFFLAFGFWAWIISDALKHEVKDEKQRLKSERVRIKCSPF